MAARNRTLWLWLLWIGATLTLLTAAAVTMAYGGSARQLFLIGGTTDAHHQIELACSACHIRWFGGRDSIEEACQACHAEDLKASKDNHPAVKFRDPRNADRLAIVDATKCLTCHIEHRPEVTQTMAVTLPIDYCSACHADIGDDRPSHKNLAFTGCANAGCHNYHDNQALYEDFLGKHLDEPAIKLDPRIALIDWRPPGETAAPPSPATTPDAPAAIASDTHAMAEWLGSSHASAGVNCSGCHQPKGARSDDAARWIAKPGMAQCQGCHADEAARFTRGKHGMRLATGLWVSRAAPFGLLSDEALGPMRPGLARLPMRSQARDRELQCGSCHTSHRFETATAKVEACLGCHDDRHTRAYSSSAHHALWQAEKAGKAPKGTGVTCATCHMPRSLQRDADGGERMIVDHNQSATMRPNEKMARTVCIDCHGLGFTLDALADRALIDRNFKGRSSVHVESIDWVERRMRQRGELP